MEEWKEYKLSELGAIIGGATPSTKDSNNYDGEISWITPKDLSNYNNRYIFRGERMITRKGYDSCSCKMLPQGSVLFSSRAPIGYVAIAGNELCTNQGFKSIVPDNTKVNSMFVYYLLIYNKNKIEGMGTGTTFKEVSGSVMRNVAVKVPSLPTQQKIANILSSLDDKIEVNRRINEQLEELAQALFKSWFVDFEPFKDGEFVESELGMIPEGCTTISISEMANYLNGLAMQKFRPLEGENGLPVLKIKELGQDACNESSELCSPSLIDEKFIVNDGDVIFSWSGTLLVKIWCGGTCGLNQHLFKVTSEKYPKWFVYLWTKYHLDRFIRIAKDKAVTMGHIKRGELDTSYAIVLNNDMMKELDAIISPIIEQFINNNIEIRKLTNLRDTLLPKLMSGEIDVNEVEI